MRTCRGYAREMVPDGFVRRESADFYNGFKGTRMEFGGSESGVIEDDRPPVQHSNPSVIENGVQTD